MHSSFMAAALMLRTYLELSELETFEERYEYLRLSSGVGIDTFGSARYLNQMFYHDPTWRSVRDSVIVRDNGCDLGIEGRDIFSRIYIHHINPITKEDVVNRDPKVFDLNNLICCTHQTHNAIHYGTFERVVHDPVERRPNDTCPWK